MIPPIPAVPSLPTGAVSGTGAAAGGTAGAGAATSGTSSFGNAVTNAIDQVQQVQTTASNDAAQAAAGQGNITDALIASTQASLDTQVTTAVANKAISAFTDVMNMQF